MTDRLKISDYTTTPSVNDRIGTIYVGEGMLPSDVNNAMRELTSQLKKFQTGADGDSVTVGGNLSVTGTSTLAGATAITGATTITGAASLTGNLTVGGNAAINGTGNLKVPVGTTGNRTDNKIGSFRYNSTTGQFEGTKGISGATISSITRVGTTATLTTATAHGLATNDYVTVVGASPADYNGTFQITSTGASTFTYVMATTPASSASTVGTYSYGLWGTVGGGASGARGDDVFYENSTTVNYSYTLSTNKNAMSVGAITIASGAAVTIPSGQRWVIL